MRLWHYNLLPVLPRNHLIGQHRECCAMRGNGWGRKHATVDYVYKYPPSQLYFYHCKVLFEINRRGWSYDRRWDDQYYRGHNCEPWSPYGWVLQPYNYPEHDDAYYQECLDNLERKGYILQKGNRFCFGSHDEFAMAYKQRDIAEDRWIDKTP
jgi:uncharacterized protein (TIGR02328 family)